MTLAAARLLCLVAFVSVVSQFGKTLLSLAGLPNAIPAVRDGLLLVLALYALSRTDVFKFRAFYLWALLCLLCIAANVLVAVAEDHHLAGLYYARIYLLPLLFAVALEGLVLRASPAQISALLRFMFYGGVLLMLVAFGIFAAVEFNPRMLRSLMGDEQGPLASAWYISGGTWLRMGLPATGPNSLGLVVGLYGVLMASVLLTRPPRVLAKPALAAALACSLLVVAMSFSRSAWLAAAAGGAVLLLACVPGAVLFSPANIAKMIGAGAAAAAVTAAALLFLDLYSEGAVGRWAALNLSGADPSIVGHQRSFVHAAETLDDYLWYGHPKGSVGPRASLFGTTVNNVENSVLAVIYDMGLPIGSVFLLAVAGMLSALWAHRSQWSVLIAFSVCAMFLPYSFEPDVVVFFLFVFVVLGRFMQCLGPAVAVRRALPAYEVTQPAGEFAA